MKKFRDHILKSPPSASQIKSVEMRLTDLKGYAKFTIAESKNGNNLVTEISPDIAVCSGCLEDLQNDTERINYPFINCTDCGPRFTIIEALPYDRHNTSMKSFKMCSNCACDYSDILNRRFHAQPVACNNCGPLYIYEDSSGTINNFEEILSAVSERIDNGKSVAIKGTGGYNLLCNALDDKAVSELRKNKLRDAKPFAVMFRDLKTLNEYCYSDLIEQKELISWRRPIMLLKQKKSLAFSVSNGLGTIGAMLPYMPVHYLLFRKLQSPVVVLTSGNISDEPIITNDITAKKYLMPITGAILSYNREIINRCDDSVIRIIGDKVNIIRRSRGYAPAPVDLNCNVEGIIAVGAEQKNTFCIGKACQAILSQYIGDIKNLPTYEFFTESVARFRGLFILKPEMIVCDLHLDYLSTTYAVKLAAELKVPLVRVQHHHAHIASCMAENHIDEKVIGISMDGTGYGSDGNIWGGEFLVADLESFERYTHFDYIPMPGGDKAIEEPWRMAFSYLYHYFGSSFDFKSIPAFKLIDNKHLDIIKEMIDKKINTPLTSGAGRLFDAAAAILGLSSYSRFDSEAPMLLESVIAPGIEDHYPFETGSKVIFAKTILAMVNDLHNTDIGIISAKFHNTLAMAITSVSEDIRRNTSVNKVILSGGVFQNKYLLEKLCLLLTERHFEVFTQSMVPSNDGGISLGQLVIASKTRESCV